MSNKGAEVTIMRMPLNKIKLGRNSRANIDQDELDGLMESIKSVGLLQPIGVVKNGTGYVVAYGNRRFLACSKLGYSHIPVIVSDTKKASEIDIKNLAENVQRKNISLVEVGRYIEILRGEGMTLGEIAVRLGTTKNYVDTCAKAFTCVPQEFQADLLDGKGQKVGTGKLAAATAMKIMNATRTFKLKRKDEVSLYKAARESDKFEPKLVNRYAKMLLAGKEDFLDQVKPIKHVRIDVLITQDHYDELYAKHVSAGPFNSVTAYMKAVLAGNKTGSVKIINEK